MLALLDQIEPFVADPAEAAIAKHAAEKLKVVAEAKQDITMVVQDHDAPKVVVPLPARAVELIHRILESMSHRVPVSVIPHEAELTTQQAAEYLNVSRPYLVGLLEKGEIDFRRVGRHRRVRFADLLTYEKKSRVARRQALDVMAEEARRLELD
jgi:excisionase family DNA binding protein